MISLSRSTISRTTTRTRTSVSLRSLRTQVYNIKPFTSTSTLNPFSSSSIPKSQPLHSLSNSLIFNHSSLSGLSHPTRYPTTNLINPSRSLSSTPFSLQDVGNPTEPSSDQVEEPIPFSSIERHLSPQLYKAIVQKPFGYLHMSPVQAALLSDLPSLLHNPTDLNSTTKDLLVKAKTGTGKTLAFLIPAIESRLRDLKGEAERFTTQNPNASQHDLFRHMRTYENDTTGIVILSPTRELATQIATEAIKLTSHIKDFGVRLFVGGASKSLQLRDWQNGRRDLIVATPGRIYDVINSNRSILNNVGTTKTLILDEADTLLEMGFKDEIDQIVQHLPPKDSRSTYLFSATISQEISRIAKTTMKSDVKIVDCVPKGESNVHAHIPQFYTVLPSPEHQLRHIFNILVHDQLLNPTGKAIIFLPTTKMTQLFSQILMSMRRHLPWNVTGLTKIYEMHGGRSQSEREHTAQDFRSGKGGGYQVLVTSDVSARGVDYPGVTRVIQIGVPTSRDIYIHRVGRTGRAGKAGRGDLVLLPWEIGYVSTSLQNIPLRPLPVRTLNEEVSDLVKTLDESGEGPTIDQTLFQRTPQRGNPRGFNSRHTKPQSSFSTRQVKMELPLKPRIDSFEQNLNENIMPSMNEESIKDSFGSLLGYYVSKSTDLRTSKDSILNGLKQWATMSMKLPEEPYLSHAFLARLGFNSPERGSSRGNSWGSRGNGGGRRETGFRYGGGYQGQGGGYGGRSGGGYGHRSSESGGYGHRSSESDGFSRNRTPTYDRRDKGSSYGGNPRERSSGSFGRFSGGGEGGREGF
ncbi:P-loop containing nucleoside triphosphate hydrolase protein [Melampsora americana]|nr:P-loop containing nucleoside triphosphate hydrolase protein [Melampsora americana]